MQQTADEDAEGISSDAHGQAILEALGLERRNEVSSTGICDITCDAELYVQTLEPGLVN